MRRATRQVVTEDKPHPAPRAGAITAKSHCVVLVGRAPTCPKHRSAAVTYGQQRSVLMPLELHERPTAGGPRELPKLAVVSWSWSALGPHGIGNRWSLAGTSGHGRLTKIAGHTPFSATTWDGKGKVSGCGSGW